MEPPAGLRYVQSVVGRVAPHARRLFDGFIALGLALLALLEIWWPGGFVATGPIEGNTAILVSTALAMTLPLAFRRRFPLATVLVVFGAAALQELLATSPDGVSGVTALLVAVYSVAAYSDRRRAVIGLVGALALSLSLGPDDAAFAAVFIGGAWGAGRIVRRQNLLLDALRRDQQERERAAVVDERARIARELHDVVAHSVSTIVVQAQAGEAMVDQGSDRAREAFVAIAGSGRQALGELRRMLGLLRDPELDPALDPQPGLPQLRTLVEQMRAVGLPVDLTVEGDPHPLPAGVDLCAYRIVQEALTNTLKHASARQVRVRVDYGPDQLDVEVSDDGCATSGGTAASGDHHGHGIAGMRERAALYGGDLHAGPVGDGGYTVHVSLPIARATP